MKVKNGSGKKNSGLGWLRDFYLSNRTGRTFSKIRRLSRNIQELSNVQDKADQKALMQRSGEMIAELLDDDLQTTDTETSIELNFAVLKFKHTIKKKNK